MTAPAPVNRINWTQLNGSIVEEVMLVAGVPGVFVAAGSALTSVAFLSPSNPVDTAWWPDTATYQTFASYRLPWLDPRNLSIGFRVRPIDGTVDAQPVTRSLFDNGVPGGGPGSSGLPTSPSAMFGSRNRLVRSSLTASVLTSDAVVHVVSTAAFAARYPGNSSASPFFISLGMESILAYVYDSTTLATVARGCFGSVVSAHYGDSSAGLLTATVYDGIPTIVGREVTIWAVERNPGFGAGSNPTLLFAGQVAPGSGARGATWRVKINHVLNQDGFRPSTPSLTLQGYMHVGQSYLVGAPVPPNDTNTPLAVLWANPSETPSRLVMLTDSATLPTPTIGALNRGGYHLTLPAFLADWNAMSGILLAGGGTQVNATLRGGSLYITASTTSSASIMHIYAGWLPGDGIIAVGSGVGDSASNYTNPAYTIPTAVPTAFLMLGLQSPVPFILSDLYQVPLADGSYPYPSSTPTEAWFALNVQIGDAHVPCIITSKDTATYASNGYGTMGLYPVGIPPRVGYGQNATYVLEPTSAPLGVYVTGASWWSAIQIGMSFVQTNFGFGVPAALIDFARIAQIGGANAGPFPTDRSYYWDPAKNSGIDLLKDEAALNGLQLAPYFGRVAVARVMDQPSNADVAYTIDATALRDGDQTQAAQTPDGLLIGYEVTIQPQGNKVVFVDQVALQENGGMGSSIKTTFHRSNGAIGILTPSDAATALRLGIQGETAIGPWATDYLVLTVHLSLAAAGVQIGDVVRFGSLDSGSTLGDWLAPNGFGGRGVSNVTGTVIGTKLDLFGADGEGQVDLDIRVSRTGIVGWAPEVLVSAISGAVLSVDVSTWGPNGYGSPTAGSLGTGLADGGASYFRVGDVCQLMNTGTATPVAPLAVTVVAVSPSSSPPTITLSASPAAAWGTLAGTPGAVTLAYATTYDGATNAGQHDYAWLASPSDALGAALANADRWSA